MLWVTRERQGLQPRFLTPTSCVKLPSLPHWESQLLRTPMLLSYLPGIQVGPGPGGAGCGQPERQVEHILAKFSATFCPGA